MAELGSLPGFLGSSHPAGGPIPCPALVTSQETELIRDTVSSSPQSGVARGLRGWNSQGRRGAFHRPSRRPDESREGRGSGASKASLQAAAVRQTAPRMNTESPWLVVGCSGDDSRCLQRHKDGWGQGGTLAQVGSFLSLKGWGDLRERGVGRHGAPRPLSSPRGSRLGAVLDVPTTSAPCPAPENPPRQGIHTCLLTQQLSCARDSGEMLAGHPEMSPMPATVPRVHQRAEDEAPLGGARRMGSSQHSSEGRRKNFLGREVASLPLTEGETEAQEVSVKELAVEHGSEFTPVPGLPRGSSSRREPQTAEQQLVVVDFSFPHLGKGLCGVWCPPPPWPRWRWDGTCTRPGFGSREGCGRLWVCCW